MIYASPGSASGTYASTDEDGVNVHTEAPTETGPDAEEVNLTP